MEKTVLIIDNDKEFQTTTGAVLKAEGYQVLIADSAEVGFEQAKNAKPAFILLDMLLTKEPGGFDITKELKEDSETKDIPIVAVSGVGKNHQFNLSYTPDNFYLPVKTVLDKPVIAETLLKTINNYL